MNTARFARFLSLLLVVAVLFSAIGAISAQDKKVIVTGISMVGGDIPTIDPQLAETSSAIEAINQMFIGLTAQDVTNNALAEGMATYEVVEGENGATTYIFTVRQDVPWVRYNPETDAVEQITDESGAARMVTAADFYYGIMRGLDPRTASPYSYIPVGYINGASDFNGLVLEDGGDAAAYEVALGELQATVAVRLVDDSTIEIDAPANTLFTAYIYGLWVMRATPQWVIEEFGDLWVEPENIATYGPFALKAWAHDESMTLIKNPFWPGTAGVPQAKIDEVVFRFLDPQQQLAEYEAGNMDAIQIPLEEWDRIQADPVLSAEYVTGTNPCSYYIGFDNLEAPTDNVHLRRALSYAVDRERSWLM